ncbi:MAG: HigA family addiction module antitoxin [Alphaproteobacteria bacterium]|nr:MAG: addiction module antidote protein, HigA family [Rickettsiaceae bacterium 4572_127]
MIKALKNPSVGEIIKEELLDDMGLSQNALARAIFVPPNRINEIIRGRRNITADTDLRLCRFFNLTQGFFLRLQMQSDMSEIHKNPSASIQKIVPYERAIK